MNFDKACKAVEDANETIRQRDTCRHCGETDLYWLPIVKPDGRTSYALHSEGNRRHVCKPDPNAFGVVPEC